MLNQYSFLFKYIIIGDASTHMVKVARRREIVHLDAVPGEQVQDRLGDHSGGVIWVEGDWGERREGQTADLGHCTILVIQAGQEIFKSITRSYYRGSIGAVLVYDVTSRDSFNNISKWIDETKNYANEKLSVILVANKIDL